MGRGADEEQTNAARPYISPAMSVPDRIHSDTKASSPTKSHSSRRGKVSNETWHGLLDVTAESRLIENFFAYGTRRLFMKVFATQVAIDIKERRVTITIMPPSIYEYILATFARRLLEQPTYKSEWGEALYILAGTM
jgi:hypothetical protein